jgi:hypothetical protein
MKTTTKKHLFRIWQDGNLFWEGRAYDVEHAEEKCFSDDSPGSLERFTMHKGNACKKTGITRWVCVYENECLAAY